MSAFPAIDSVFEERYRLIDVLGEGGAARVYLATQEDLGRKVAIKVLRPKHRSSAKAEEMVKRFVREAKLVSQLRDPHTITVYDFGTTDEGLVYMVTEFIKGQNLLEFIHANGPIRPSVVARMTTQLLFSLLEAHQHGMLHRDIKPANVMVHDLPGRPNQIKLLDFGIAKAFEEVDDGQAMNVSLTAQGRVIGSPGYMSPEQIYGQELGPESDIYSVGLVAYEMLTGTRAIKSTDDLTAAHEQISATPIVLPDDLELPPKLRQVVEKMVLKDVKARYPSVLEVITELEPLSAPQSAAHQAIGELDEESEVLLLEEVGPERRKSLTALVLVALVALILIAIVVAGQI